VVTMTRIKAKEVFNLLGAYCTPFLFAWGLTQRGCVYNGRTEAIKQPDKQME
jgi:hypothetical protein